MCSMDCMSITFNVCCVVYSLLYVYLFQRDSYLSGISAEPSALIHEYAKIFENNELK